MLLRANLKNLATQFLIFVPILVLSIPTTNAIEYANRVDNANYTC